MKKQGGSLSGWGAVLTVGWLISGCASDGPIQLPSTTTKGGVDLPQADPGKFAFEKSGVASLPAPGASAPIYAEFTGVPAFDPALRQWLRSRGYRLADAPGTGVAKLQLAGDYLAYGWFQVVGRVRTGNVDLGKVLGRSSLTPNKTPEVGALAIADIGKELSGNYHALQISGGSIAGGFGVQAVMAGLFDLTGLTGWIQRTHGPSSYDDPTQIVNIWMNYTSGDGAIRSNSRIEARCSEPILAPALLAGAAMDYALSSMATTQPSLGAKP